jgi:hypothetical protein
MYGRYQSGYITRILRSNEKWHDKKVVLLRDARTKGGVEFKKGEVLRVCGVTKPGCVDLSAGKGRVIFGVDFKSVETIEFFELREGILAKLEKGGEFTISELCRAFKATPYMVQKALKKLSKQVGINTETKKYRWVLPKARVRWTGEQKTIWERLEDN